MITKETFIKIIEHIHAQQDINEKVDEALTLVSDGQFLFGVKDRYKDALLLVLKEIFDDQGDWISWWLYETEDYTVYEKIDGDETILNLRQPEAFYDFLVTNKTSHELDIQVQ